MNYDQSIVEGTECATPVKLPYHQCSCKVRLYWHEYESMSTQVMINKYQSNFKIATLTYKTLATCQSSYVYNLLQLHQPS